MNAIYLKSIWKGYYFQRTTKQIGHRFTLELMNIDGVLSGRCIEPRIAHLMNGDITINGFIEDGFISFIKQYPIYWTMDANRQIRTDPTRKHPEIHYTGFYEEQYEILTGKWEIPVYERDQPGKKANRTNGTWIVRLDTNENKG